MSGTVGVTAKRHVWSKISRRITVKEFINQCYSFEHTGVIYSQWSCLKMCVT